MEAALVSAKLTQAGASAGEFSTKEEEAYSSHQADVAAAADMTSTNKAQDYYHGPPPPYSLPTPSISLPTATNRPPDIGTPPDSRHPSGVEKDVAVQSTKQSLPSISEALGVDNQAPYQSSLSAQAPPPLPIPSLPGALHKSMIPTSPVPAMRLSAAEPAQPHAEAYISQGSYAARAPKFQGSDAARPSFPGVKPSLQLSTAQQSYHSGSAAGLFPHLSSSSPVYERGSQASAPTSFTYGYTPYPSRYQPSSASTVIYQPSTNHPAPQPWKDRTHRDEKSFGESVKRHLDMYDLEASLNDVTASSNFLGDFAHRYGNLLHQSPRSGPHLTMLPSIIEIEDMISKSRAQTEALIKVRETVLAQQAAHDQEAAEQRQQKAYSDLAPPSSGDSDDGKSYAGSDAKKRRGRAAPPGRCHSCNRAETPEWRRGPDGARTLCNACGLHYAKLTRKQNNMPKTSAINSSNLRPKEHMP